MDSARKADIARLEETLTEARRLLDEDKTLAAQEQVLRAVNATPEILVDLVAAARPVAFMVRTELLFTLVIGLYAFYIVLEATDAGWTASLRSVGVAACIIIFAIIARTLCWAMVLNYSPPMQRATAWFRRIPWLG